MSGTIDLIGGAHPLRQETIRLEVPEGETLEDMVRRVQPDPALWPMMRVWIDGHLILPGIYHRVKPKAGRQVVIKAWVGKGIIGALLSIVLTIVAPWAGGIIAGWAGFAATGFAAQLIGAGITLLGTLALQGLVKPPTLSAPERVEALPGLRGSRNELRRDGAVPVVLGRHLIAPLLGAEPYTENIGDDVYLRQLFVVGYGPLTIEDIKIGDTPIDRFDDVQIEVREGLPTDTPVTLYPDVAFQEPLSISVERNTWNARFTASDADLIYVDIEWPNGLVWFTDGGQKLLRRHLIEVEYRPAAGGAWVATAGIDIEENRQRTIRRTVSIPVPRGQYEVQVRRVDDPRYPDVETTNSQDTFVQDVVWTGLRTFRSENPVQLGKPLALIALRIKATEQLNGVVDQLNCVATSRALAWNGSAWVMGPTSNPAALYRWLLQGPMVRRPVADPRMDLASLQDWAEKCDAAGREVNAVLTEKTTMFELIRDVAAVGRALPSMADGKYGVTLDEPQTVPRQMFTPRNIISASFERYYQDLPDGLRVRFRSAPALWSEDEVVVYNDGKTKANAVTFETLNIWGITDPVQAQYEGHYYFRAAKLRPESAQITTDVEGLVCRPGDMVRLAHDALLVGLAQGRIAGLTVDGSGNVTAIRLDAECVMVGGTSYGVVIRLPGGALEVARQVVTVAGATQDLTLSAAIPAAGAPQVGDLVAFGELGKEVSDWTVRGIEREDDLVARLSLVPHAPLIHDTTGVVPDYDPVITTPMEERKPAAPVVLKVLTGTVALERVRGRVEPQVAVTVRHGQGAAQPPIARIEVQWRLETTRDWRGEGVRIEGLTSFLLRNVDEGERIAFRVRAISESGRVSDWTVQTGVTVLGILEPPGNVENFSLESVGTRSRLTWDPVPGLDISHYVIKWSRLTTGATWANSTTILARVASTSATVPTRVGTYLIRAVDTGGRMSPVAAIVVTTLARVEGINLVQNVIEDPAFAGSFSQTYLDASLGGVRLAARSGPAATSSDLHTSGTYTFANAVNLGGIWTSRVTADLDVVPADLGADVHAWDDIHAIPNVYGAVSGEEVDAVLQIRTTQVAPASNIWSPWQDFVLGDYTCWGMQFRVRLKSTVRGLSPVVTRLRTRVDMEERRETFSATVAAAGQTWTFARAFYQRPVVNLTMLDGQSGDRVAITAVSATGATVRVFNSAGTGVARDVEMIAVGYGGKE